MTKRDIGPIAGNIIKLLNNSVFIKSDLIKAYCKTKGLDYDMQSVRNGLKIYCNRNKAQSYLRNVDFINHFCVRHGKFYVIKKECIRQFTPLEESNTIKTLKTLKTLKTPKPIYTKLKNSLSDNVTYSEIETVMNVLNEAHDLLFKIMKKMEK